MGLFVYVLVGGLACGFGSVVSVGCGVIVMLDCVFVFCYLCSVACFKLLFRFVVWLFAIMF